MEYGIEPLDIPSFFGRYGKIDKSVQNKDGF